MLTHKKNIYFVALLFVYTASKQETFIPRPLNPIPPHLLGEVNVKVEGTTQRYLNKDTLDRDIIEVAYPNGHVIWTYFDSSGRVSSLDRNSKNNQEIEYVALIDKTGTVKNYHLDVIDDMRDFLHKDCFLDTTTQQTQPTPPPNDYTDTKNSYNDNYDAPIENPNPLPIQDNSWFSTPMLVGCSFTGSVVLLVYYLMKQASICSRYLSKDTTWSTWKSEESYGALLSVEPKYLSNDLVDDINIKYCDDTNPIARFFEEVESEYDTLLQWIQFRNKLYWFHLPVEKSFNMIERRLALLEHMRKAVNYWRGQQISKKSKAVSA